jgi:hypothetical protein
MIAVTLKAHYDGRHICLDEPCELQPGSKLMVTVVPEPDEALEEEREAWFALARQSLARGYGDDEPDYSDYIGKTPPAE